MLLVGLTGGIGSGKSTVARMLAARGAVVLDSDAFARAAVASGTPGFDRVVSLFGPGIVRADGELDRAAIADRVFADPELRSQLEAIVHPEVRGMIAEAVAAEANTDHVVVVDSPLLIETGAHRLVPVLIVVSASPETQIRRLLARGMAEADARARLAAQMPLADKSKLAHVILDNEGTEAELEAQVDQMWDTLAIRATRA